MSRSPISLGRRSNSMRASDNASLVRLIWGRIAPANNAGVSCLLGNYLLGEDQKGGSSYFRDFEHPLVGSYNNINYATNTPHAMGSIQSKVFWLLAQTGTNTWNNISVTGIGRASAEKI